MKGKIYIVYFSRFLPYCKEICLNIFFIKDGHVHHQNESQTTIANISS